MSNSIGTALTPSACKVLFCGAGELGKEVVIAMQRFGVEVIAVDRYPNAPGMQGRASLPCDQHAGRQ